jgi:hypothetical protein
MFHSAEGVERASEEVWTVSVHVVSLWEIMAEHLRPHAELVAKHLSEMVNFQTQLQVYERKWWLLLGGKSSRSIRAKSRFS